MDNTAGLHVYIEIFTKYRNSTPMTLSKSYISLEPLYHLQGNRLVILASSVCILRTFTKEGLEYITNRRQKKIRVDWLFYWMIHPNYLNPLNIDMYSKLGIMDSFPKHVAEVDSCVKHTIIWPTLMLSIFCASGADNRPSNQAMLY